MAKTAGSATSRASTKLARESRFTATLIVQATHAAPHRRSRAAARDRARAWSLRIYEDYPSVEGIYYYSSMDGTPVVPSTNARKLRCRGGPGRSAGCGSRPF